MKSNKRDCLVSDSVSGGWHPDEGVFCPGYFDWPVYGMMRFICQYAVNSLFTLLEVHILLSPLQLLYRSLAFLFASTRETTHSEIPFEIPAYFREDREQHLRHSLITLISNYMN